MRPKIWPLFAPAPPPSLLSTLLPSSQHLRCLHPNTCAAYTPKSTNVYNLKPKMLTIRHLRYISKHPTYLNLFMPTTPHNTDPVWMPTLIATLKSASWFISSIADSIFKPDLVILKYSFNLMNKSYYFVSRKGWTK